MKDNIKNIFDNAIESDDTNINAEKIQNTVMERLEKQARENLKLSDVEETVEPVFVTPPQKNGKFTALKIAAGTVAACLGIVVIGNAVYWGDNGLNALSESITDAEESAPQAEETSNTLQQENESIISEKNKLAEDDDTKSSSNTDSHNNETGGIKDFDGVFDEDNSALADESIPVVDCTPHHEDYKDLAVSYSNGYPDIEFALLDGSMMKYGADCGIGRLQNKNPKYLISYRDGRLYYVGNGKNIDVTDIISDGSYFQDWYINSVTGLKHYIFVGGDLEKMDFGYFDVFNFSKDLNVCNVEYIYHCDSDKIAGDGHSQWQEETWTKIIYELEQNKQLGEIAGGNGQAVDFTEID